MQNKHKQFTSKPSSKGVRINAGLSVRRAIIPEDGVQFNKHTVHTHETAFENIKAKINVTRTKLDEPLSGVVKGTLLRGVPITVVSNTAASTTQAIKKRTDYPPNVTDPAVFREGHNLLMEKFDPLPVFDCSRELVEEYFDSLKEAKKARLEAALAQDELSYDGEEKMVFAKMETLLKEHHSQGRLVVQGTDMYNALTGVIVYQLAKRMKKTFSRENPKNTGNIMIFACGMTGESLGEVIAKAPGVMVESDASSNDATQSGAWRKYEAMFYKKLGAPDWFVREFARNTKIKIWTRVGIATVLSGQRWSGESTTTTGNTYVGMCDKLRALKQADITMSTNIHGGDDYLGLVPEDKAETFVTRIDVASSQIGMIAKPIIPKSRDHGTFYRKRFPVSPEAGCRPIPQMGRVLAKLPIRANMNQEVNDKDYMAGKLMSAAYESRYDPIISGMLRKAGESLSDNAYFDDKEARSRFADRAHFEHAMDVVPHGEDTLTNFYRDVYDLDYECVANAFQTVIDSIIAYCDKWVVRDKRSRLVNLPDNWKYEHEWLDSDCALRLAEIDCN